MSILERLRSREGTAGLLDAALLVRRAGLEHLVTDPSLEEVLAMVHAGELVAHERAELAAKAIRSPLEFMALVDGGDALVASSVDGVLASAVARRAPHAS